MKINLKTCLVGKRCVLVPYRREHVPTYHAWMRDPYLLEATRSEPLSLSQEFSMQNSWRDDETKCTFIVLDKTKCVGLPSDEVLNKGQCENGNDSTKADNSSSGEIAPDADKASTNRKKMIVEVDMGEETEQSFITQNIGAMVGDVNLFISFLIDEEEDEKDDNEGAEKCLGGKRLRRNAELDIMIAEASTRRKGLGSEACRIMMIYGKEKLDIHRYFAKIGEKNEASLSLFENRLKYTECNYSECFREKELEYRCDEENIQKLCDEVGKVISFEC